MTIAESTTTTLRLLSDRAVEIIFEKEDLSSIVPKLFEIMEKAPVLRKEGLMELGGSKKLKYLAIDTILEQLRQIIVDARVFVQPVLISTQSHIKYGQLPAVDVKPEQWSGKIPTKSIRESQGILWRFIDVDNPASYLCTVVSAEAMDTQDKASNKALTAAYKQALIKTFMLITGEPEVEDDQNQPDGPAEEKPKRGEQMTRAAQPAQREAKATERQERRTTTDPRPEDPTAKALKDAKEALRVANSVAGLSKEQIDEIGQEVTGNPRSKWIESPTQIQKIVKAVQTRIPETQGEPQA